MLLPRSVQSLGAPDPGVPRETSAKLNPANPREWPGTATALWVQGGIKSKSCITPLGRAEDLLGNRITLTSILLIAVMYKYSVP